MHHFSFWPRRSLIFTWPSSNLKERKQRTHLMASSHFLFYQTSLSSDKGRDLDKLYPGPHAPRGKQKSCVVGNGEGNIEVTFYFVIFSLMLIFNKKLKSQSFSNRIVDIMILKKKIQRKKNCIRHTLSWFEKKKFKEEKNCIRPTLSSSSSFSVLPLSHQAVSLIHKVLFLLLVSFFSKFLYVFQNLYY